MTADWEPSYRTPAHGSAAFGAADPNASPAPMLDPDLPVMIVATESYGWTRVRCENGWETWVDGTKLVPLPVAAPPPPVVPPAPVAPPPVAPVAPPPVAPAAPPVVPPAPVAPPPSSPVAPIAPIAPIEVVVEPAIAPPAPHVISPQPEAAANPQPVEVAPAPPTVSEPEDLVDWELVRLIAPVLSGPAPPGGYPSMIVAVIPPDPPPGSAPRPPPGTAIPDTYAPAAYPAAAPQGASYGLPYPSPAVPDPGRPGAQPSRSKTTMLLMIGFAVITTIGLLALGVTRGQSDPESGVYTVISVVMIVLMIAVFAMGLVGIRTPARTRPAFELARAAICLVTVFALGAITGATAQPVVRAIGLTLGLAGGLIEGAMTRVVAGSDGVNYARRAVLPMTVSFGGLLVGVAAATGNAGSIAAIGQLIGLIGVGLMFGVPVGRTLAHQRVRPALGGIAALLFAGATIAAPIIALASAQQAMADPSPLDGTYTGSISDTAAFENESVITANTVELSLADGHLSGTIVLGSKQTFAFEPAPGRNQIPICSVLFAELTGSELTAAPEDRGEQKFSGSVQFLASFDEVTSACATPDSSSSLPFASGPMAVTINDQGLTGNWVGSDGELDLGTGQLDSAPPFNFTATRTSGAPTPPPDPGSGQTPGSSRTTGSGAVHTVSPDPTKALTGSAPNIPADVTPGAAIATVTGLAAAGAISAAEAAAAKRKLMNDAVPRDVLAELAPKIKMDQLDFGTVFSPTPDQQWDAIRHKLRTGAGVGEHFAGREAEHPVFTIDEIDQFIGKIEEAMPGATWQQIVAALHDGRYGGHSRTDDVNKPFPHTTVRLFEQGPETEGWQDVRKLFDNLGTRGTLTGETPWFVTDRQGRKIDINHVWAGVRSDLNRPPDWGGQAVKIPGTDTWLTFNRDFMRWANTKGGDLGQALTNDFRKGTRNKDSTFGWWPEYIPPDQQMGNEASHWLSNFYREPANQNVPLSQALKQMWNQDFAKGIRDWAF